MAGAVVVTRNFRHLATEERRAYRSILNQLARAGETRDFGVLYMIEQRADLSGQVKIGITSQTGLPGRAAANQTGSPYEQRVVTLCMFESREAAALVERQLKARHHAPSSPLRTEWIGRSRHDLVVDVLDIAHSLHIDQQLINSDRERVTPIGRIPDRNFYGVLLLDIENGAFSRYSFPTQQSGATQPWWEVLLPWPFRR